ncbi:MAG: tRNA (adenosine(37)-N6)-threonylcarbamoyltransferase complex dimerization subunit type 1 TsaB [Betaproteobacteria bacterium]|nr:tRNA (adenosine(37)-N6)-threonylcarbamoyltransferase complex dimerization subunit type 1 TsaB [Betaproteobacteria bacterium]MDE2424099.1 tRNA (adenosine(37)-N6)-threonylcarbamoyltransferase complex dimerization subunit type 1 TsaB [Betaproteobacteria bacterium]
MTSHLSEPILLAIDTSTEQGSVCLSIHDQTYSSEWLGAEKHVESILFHIKEILLQSNTSIEAISAIAFAQGPGSFTGLRAGCGVTQGLSLAHDIPVIAVPTLLMLAEQVSKERVSVLLDARMGQVYGACYRRTPQGWQEISACALYQPDQLDEAVLTTEVMVGSGVDLYQDTLSTSSANTLPPALLGIKPHARWLIALAKDKWLRGELLSGHEAIPVYVRDKVALTTLERSQKS